jgi:enoyl-CoA hydratase/carnithine racemase
LLQAAANLTDKRITVIAVRVLLPRVLDVASVDRLAEELALALASPAAVVLVTGGAADMFCTGSTGDPLTAGESETYAFSRVLTAMHHAPKPLLAAVDGPAIGAGMGLACACDWVVATERSTFGLPELLSGRVPAITWPLITDRMAPHVARQWAISCQPRSAREAFDAGLADEIVPIDRLPDGIARATRALERLDPEALVRLRRWARSSRRHDLPTALSMGVELSAELGQPRKA